MSEGPIFLKGPGEPGTADALKERAATALEQGYRFVEAHGDPLARLRCQAAVEAVAPEAVVQAIEAEQAADGSFGPLIPVRPARWQMELDEWQAPASVAGTLEALAMLAGQKSLVLPSVEAAVEFLGAAQNADGSWGEGGGAERPEARLFGSGRITGLLGRTRCVRPAVLDDASAFLAELWAPERVEGGDWGALTGFANFFTNVHHDLSDAALQWCGREIERGFRTRAFEAAVVARVLMDCDVSMLPGATLSPMEILEGLLSEQARDGGWGELEAGGLPARIEPTLDAVSAIPRLCAGF
ncbi:MAG: prenyltransferase/squalene oxidase repeat-containing protein [Myxococcota bacterium]